MKSESGFKAYFSVEIKNALNRRNIIVFTIIALILLFSISNGRGKFNQTIQDRHEFQKFEAKKVKQYIYLTQYGGFGFWLFFSPSPLSIIADSDLDVNLIAQVNAHNSLEIFRNSKNKSIFSQKNFNYSNLILIIGGILALFYGLSAFNNKNYIRFLSHQFDHRKLFRYALFSRSIIFIIGFLILHFFMLIYLLMYGINLFSIHSFLSELPLILTFALLIAIGCGIGTINKREVALFWAGAVLAASLFILPFALNIFAEKIIAGHDSPYKIGYKNLSIIMSLEDELLSRYGKFIEENGITDELKERLEKATADEYEKVKHNETEIIEYLKKGMHRNNLISMMFPINFSKSVKKELGGGKGYHNFINFYRFALETKEGFTRYFFKLKAKEREPKKGTIESFIKGNENIFYAVPRLPSTYPIGIVISLLYIAAASFIAYRRYLRIFNATSEDRNVAEKISLSQPLRLLDGTLEYFRTKSNEIVEYLYQAFCGHCPIESEIDHDMSNFIYLPAPEDIPICKKILTSLAGFPPSYTKDKEKWEILFRVAAGTGKIIFVDGWFDDLKPDKMEIIKNITKQRKLQVFCIGRESDFEYADEIVISVTDDSIKASKYLKMIMAARRSKAISGEN